MTDPSDDRRVVRVVRVDDDSWEAYRDVRLSMLRDAPRAYARTYAESAQRSDDQWRAFATSALLWLAYAGAPGPEHGAADSVALDVAVGAVGMYPDPELPSGSTSLVGMWVHPDHRGSGVAEVLLREVVDTASARGFDQVVLEVTDENARAVAFYTRMGFVPTGITAALPWDETITETQLARRIR